MNYKDRINQLDFDNHRNYMKFQLLNQWMRLRNRGVHIHEFFSCMGLRKISIYGMGELGRLLLEELGEDKETEIVFGIDQRSDTDLNIPVYHLEDIPFIPEAIVISLVNMTDETEDRIFELYGDLPVFTIEEVLFELSRKHGIQSALWNV